MEENMPYKVIAVISVFIVLMSTCGIFMCLMFIGNLGLGLSVKGSELFAFVTLIITVLLIFTRLEIRYITHRHYDRYSLYIQE